MGAQHQSKPNPMPFGTKCEICGKLAKRTQRFNNVVAKIDVFFCSPNHKREYIVKLQTKEHEKLKIQLETVK